MTAKANKGKTKKLLETTLGKAPSEKLVDLSHVRKPINTSVHGLKQIIALLRTATDEVQGYVTHECDILYECRICRTIFRSLANFILHKRSYCPEKFTCFDDGPHKFQEETQQKQQATSYIIDGEAKDDDQDEDSGLKTQPDTTNNNNKSLAPIIEKLKENLKIQELANAVLLEDLEIPSLSLSSSKPLITPNKSEDQNDIFLQKIETTDSAVFQTIFDNGSTKKPELMKNEVMEIHGIIHSDEVVLGADGKVCSFETNKIHNMRRPHLPKRTISCIECNLKFSTKKTLAYHIRYKHNGTSTVYLCPICKETFPNPWCIYRHLYKVHRRSNAQVKRMRSQIHANAIRRNQESTIIKKKDTKKSIELKPDSGENQWLDNFEGASDLPRCGGCGRTFERKAALHSHSQMCTKRIAVCNSIKGTKVKVAKERSGKGKGASKESIKHHTSADVVIPKGSAKRKSRKINKIVSSDKAVVIKSAVIADEKIIISTDNSVDSFEFTAANVLNIIGIPKIDPPAIIEEVSVDENLRQDVKETDKNDVLIETVTNDGQISCSPSVTNDEHSIIIEDSISYSSDIIELVPEQQQPEMTIEKQSIKRKRSASCNSRNLSDYIDECKETGEFNHEDEESFLTKASSYMDETKLMCISCQVSYASRYQLLWHMSLHFSWFRFQCSRCSFMSFNKYECVTHAHMHHSIPNHLMESTVLPIADWKTVLMSHEFRLLQNQEFDKTNGIRLIKEQQTDDDNNSKPLINNATSNYSFDNYCDLHKKIEDLEISKKTNKFYFNSKSSISNNSTGTMTSIDDNNVNISLLLPSSSLAVDVPEEIYVGNNSDGIFVEETNDTGLNVDPLEIEDVGKIGAENDVSLTKITSPTASNNNNNNLRPTRIRTKSIKTIQNDFIYDLNKVMKLNKTGGTRGRKGQNLSGNKVLKEEIKRK